MAAFFKVTHTDIVNCLSQLSMLRLSDYTVEIEKGGLDVHVEVCAKMRAKLVSEVKENIQQLKVWSQFSLLLPDINDMKF